MLTNESGNIPGARRSHGTISGLVATRLIASGLAIPKVNDAAASSFAQTFGKEALVPGRTPIPHASKTGHMPQLMVAHASNVGSISNEGIGAEREEALKRTP
ncbi:MAG TPA: hypothetical protein VFU49_13840 [Ktedonobacteraceae bacterium]|nr:hypothetical protein [Ktedonobacteraceae bacterium]